jgi:hypothetical protein
MFLVASSALNSGGRKMEKKISKNLIIIFVVFSILFSFCSFVFADTYTSWVTVYTEYEGANRYYSGQSIKIVMNDIELLDADDTFTTFTVKLWKESFWGDTRDSGVLTGYDYDENLEQPMNYSKIWTSLGDGYYHFSFWKQTPWIDSDERVYCPNILMLSY